LKIDIWEILWNRLRYDLSDCSNILELGCGLNSPILKLGFGKRTTAVDIFEPYVTKHITQKDYLECICNDIIDVTFPQKSFDAVVLLDVLEHIERNLIQEKSFLENIESWARKKVIIFTPNGWIPNDITDNNIHQTHLSSWVPSDYRDKGYSVYGMPGLKRLFTNNAMPKFRPISLCLGLSLISQPLVYHWPEIAFQCYAIKILK
jgi:hypothetical protein